MSILIKGMDMPTTPKAIVIYPNGTIIDGDKKGTKILKAKAIEIPTPHGRLIDGDKLKDTLKEYCIDDDEKVAEWYRIMGIDEAIDDNAPTILEAEE